VDDSDRQNSVRSAAVTHAKGIRSAQLLSGPPRTRNPLFAVEKRPLQFSQYYGDPTPSALHQEVSNILWRKKHQSRLPAAPCHQQCPALQATPDCTLPALQFNTLSIRLHLYSAIPKFNIAPVRAHEFRDRQENSARPTPHLHLQPESTQHMWHCSPHTQRPLPSPHAQDDAVKGRRWQQEGLGTQRSSYKHHASEECISIASYCLPGTAAGWAHNPSCPEPSPFGRRQDRTGQSRLLHSLFALLSQRAAAGQGKHVKLLFQLARGVEGVQPRAYTARAQVCGRESRVSRQHRAVKRGPWAWTLVGEKLASEQAKLL